MTKRIGVDIGGSHITSAIIGEKGNIIESIIRMKVDAGGTSEEIFKTWASCIKPHAKHQSNYLIGLSIPGPVSYKNGISYIQNQGKYDSLYGKNVKEGLAKELKIPLSQIRLGNDAACHLMGECKHGVFKGSNKVLGIIMGTGLGSAYFEDNEAQDAELWKLPLRGSIIADELLTTRWFVNQAYLRARIHLPGVKELIARNAEITKELFLEFSQNLADFISVFVQKKGTSNVLLGGNIAKASSFFLPDVIKILKNKGLNCDIRLSHLGEEAALLGAVMLFE